ncbi:glutathione S-transferase U7-like [Teratosphaeria destructans]|uniref:Glutathione S-transferase U7-like n=1 Tax=Teratosphaeria destructans TaxID=418781 RepID=A0A9W7T1U0_9PEZI|nr:glutathione S-transferase U7-like [Teratosphaeria destructans]
MPTNGTKPELDANQGGDPNKKTYNKQATGEAWKTVQAHSQDNNIRLYGSCFCPFVHRVWISLEHKGLSYQYIEVDVYRKPKLLLDINPRGLVPALRHGDWGCYESTVLMEYLEDLDQGKALLPKDPKLRAESRLWSDHINRHIIPLFYKYLQAQAPQDQANYAKDLTSQIAKLVSAASATGPFFLGSELSFVDVQIAPWVVRLEKVLKPYRGWPDPEPGSRWEKWVRAIEGNEAVQKTTSDDQLYLDSYERYAENRPNTSEVQKAINSGTGLP